jgi:hypothetical protein
MPGSACCNKPIPNPRFTQRGFQAWVWNSSRQVDGPIAERG